MPDRHHVPGDEKQNEKRRRAPVGELQNFVDLLSNPNHRRPPQSFFSISVMRLVTEFFAVVASATTALRNRCAHPVSSVFVTVALSSIITCPRTPNTVPP